MLVMNLSFKKEDQNTILKVIPELLIADEYAAASLQSTR